MTVTPTDAKARAIVAAPDGTTGILIYVPPPAGQRHVKRKHVRRHAGAKAVVKIGSRYYRWLPDELVTVDTEAVT